MKIAFIAPRYHTNQTAIISYLVDENILVDFYVTRIGQSEDHTKLIPTIIKQSSFHKFIKKLIKPKNDILYDYKYGIPSLNELYKYIVKKYDIVIIRNPNNSLALLYAICSKISKTKVVFYTQKEVYTSKNRLLKDFITKLLIRIFDANWISPCLGDANYPKVSERLEYVPFCINIEKYSKEWFINSKINILAIGKFEERKKHLLLIHALLKMNSINSFTLTIIGEVTTPEHQVYLEKVKKLISLNNIDVLIKTNVRPDKMKVYYMKSDLFVLPSVNEPASVSNLEAMSYALPVITTDTNKTSCYTENNYNGYIVKSNDLADLTSKLKLLVDDKEKIKKFGFNSLQLVAKNHSANFVYKNYLNSILGNEV